MIDSILACINDNGSLIILFLTPKLEWFKNLSKDNISLIILILTLSVLIWQVSEQRKAVMVQTDAMKIKAYSRCLDEFSETRRWLCSNKLNDSIYANVSNQDHRYEKWKSYNKEEKDVYTYFELVYDILYRVFELQEQGWISQKEWKIWIAWCKDLSKHKIFHQVYKDNREYYSDEFVNFISDCLK
jgi:hypothetical protein